MADWTSSASVSSRPACRSIAAFATRRRPGRTRPPRWFSPAAQQCRPTPDRWCFEATAVASHTAFTPPRPAVSASLAANIQSAAPRFVKETAADGPQNATLDGRRTSIHLPQNTNIAALEYLYPDSFIAFYTQILILFRPYSIVSSHLLSIYKRMARSILQYPPPIVFCRGLACIPKPRHRTPRSARSSGSPRTRRRNAASKSHRRGDHERPLWDPGGNPMWDAVAAERAGRCIFHTIGQRRAARDFTKLPPKGGGSPPAPGPASPASRCNMSDVLMSVMFCRACSNHHPGIKLVIGEGRHRLIPYILQRMDAEWEDQFKELDLKMPPSEYWRRQLLRHLSERPDRGENASTSSAEENIMWGSDFPAPRRRMARNFAGVHFQARGSAHLPEATACKDRLATTLRNCTGFVN